MYRSPSPSLVSHALSVSPGAWIADYEDSGWDSEPRHSLFTSQKLQSSAWIADLVDVDQPQSTKPHSSRPAAWIADLEPWAGVGDIPDNESVISSAYKDSSVVASIGYSSEANGPHATIGLAASRRRFWTTEDSVRDASYGAPSSRGAPSIIGSYEPGSSSMQFVHPASIAPKRRREVTTRPRRAPDFAAQRPPAVRSEPRGGGGGAGGRAPPRGRRRRRRGACPPPSCGT